MPRGLTSYSCYLCVKNNTPGGDKCKGPGPECPTCANFTCGYCKQKGHTIKHCQVLAGNKQKRRDDLKDSKRSTTDADGFSTVSGKKRASKAQAEAAAETHIPIGRHSKFAALPKMKLTAPTPADAAKPVLSGWAAKAASLSSSDAWKDTSAPKPQTTINFAKPTASTRWADWDEDEDTMWAESRATDM